MNKKLAIGAVVGFIAISLITFATLSLLFPKQKTADDTKNASGASAKDIVEAYKKPEAIAELSSLYTQADMTVTGFNSINYTKPSSYTLTIPAADFVQYVQKDTAKNDNAASVVSATESFLATKGLTKLPSSGSTPSVYTIYDGDQAACQVVNLPKVANNAASLSLSCADKAVVTSTYDEIDKLLALSATQIKPTTIQKVSITEGNKTLTTLNMYGDTNNTRTLLFAAIDNSWEYIGERPLSSGTTEGNPNGIDRTLSNELKAKIADPKYQGFLKKYIL